jgi:hypothetical protein
MNHVLPSEAFLLEVERAFSVTFPRAFHAFCRSPDRAEKFSGLRRGVFIIDLVTLEECNRQVGSEEWGDYERIIAGKEHPKRGDRLWGGLLPFYFEPPKVKRRRKQKLARHIYGFDADAPGSERVLVWSVHCIVGAYPTLQAWLDEYET